MKKWRRFWKGYPRPFKKSGPGVTAPWRSVKGLIQFEIMGLWKNLWKNLWKKA
jgi:hypothetical protein